MQNSKGELQAFFQGVETRPFEDCLAESRRLLALYAACLHSKSPTGTTSVDIAMQAAIRNVTNLTSLFGFAPYTASDADREIDSTRMERGPSALLPSFYGIPNGIPGRDGNQILAVRRRQLVGSDAVDEERDHAFEDEPLTEQEQELMRAMGT